MIKVHAVHPNNIIIQSSIPCSGQGSYNNIFPYFDIVRQDWLCFRVDSILEKDLNDVL